MNRVPDTGLAARQREKTVKHLLSKLAYFQSIKGARRTTEHADEGEETCRALLADLGAPGFSRPDRTTVEIVDLDEFLKQVP